MERAFWVRGWVPLRVASWLTWLLRRLWRKEHLLALVRGRGRRVGEGRGW